jgi:hypothetical protein
LDAEDELNKYGPVPPEAVKTTMSLSVAVLIESMKAQPASTAFNVNPVSTKTDVFAEEMHPLLSVTITV